MISQYKAHRIASLSRFGKPIRPATVNRQLAILRGMFNAAQRGVLLMKGSVPEKNPVTACLSFAKKPNERDTVISPEELQRPMEVSPAWLQPIILMAHDSGMRRGESVRLQWRQVDLKTRMMKLTSLDTNTDEKRHISLSDRLVPLLSATPWHVSGYLFVGRQGRPYHPTALRLGFMKACTQAHLEGVVFHDLPHTFCTNRRRAGTDTLTAMASSGHKSLAVFRRYNTIAPQDLRKAIQQLGISMDTTSSQSHTSTR